MGCRIGMGLNDFQRTQLIRNDKFQEALTSCEFIDIDHNHYLPILGLFFFHFSLPKELKTHTESKEALL